MADHPKHHLLTQEEIAKVAYEMYLIEGRPEGRDVDHWLEAERQLGAQRSQEQPGSAVMKLQPTVRTKTSKKAKPKGRGPRKSAQLRA